MRVASMAFPQAVYQRESKSVDAPENSGKPCGKVLALQSMRTIPVLKNWTMKTVSLMI